MCNFPFYRLPLRFINISCVCAAEGRAVRPAYAQISTVIIARISAERYKAKRQAQKHHETLWMRFNVSLSSILWCNQRNASIERQKNQCGLPTNPLGSRPAEVIICGPQMTKANRQIKAQQCVCVCECVCVCVCVCVYGRRWRTCWFSSAPEGHECVLSPERHTSTYYCITLMSENL